MKALWAVTTSVVNSILAEALQLHWNKSHQLLDEEWSEPLPILLKCTNITVIVGAASNEYGAQNVAVLTFAVFFYIALGTEFDLWDTFTKMCCIYW